MKLVESPGPPEGETPYLGLARHGQGALPDSAPAFVTFASFCEKSHSLSAYSAWSAVNHPAATQQDLAGAGQKMASLGQGMVSVVSRPLAT